MKSRTLHNFTPIVSSKTLKKSTATSYRDKCHVDWVKSFLEFLTQLAAYVKTHHTTGLVWNEKGQEALSAAPPSVAAAPAAISGNLFGELQGNVTAGLRKVDKAQVKLEKANATPIQPKEPVARAVTTPAPAKSKPPVLELQGNKWVVENQMNQSNLVISGVEIRHVVYIYNCQNSTIKIDGKVNAITLDSCKKTGLLVSDVVASLETVNCKSVQIQVTGKLPLVQIDKTDGCQLYLSKESLECQVYSAKSSELNILVPTGDEFAEKPVCEQFKTTIVNGELVTECVVHKE
jgi:adenylyl cyclase-associated protein